MTKILNHHDFATVESVFERLDALPHDVVYGQLVNNPDWGKKMLELVPSHMHYSVVVWVAFGQQGKLGDFMRALLSNDLMGAFKRADDYNIANMQNWVRFLYNYAPAACFGSPSRVLEWQGILEVEEEDDQ